MPRASVMRRRPWHEFEVLGGEHLQSPANHAEVESHSLPGSIGVHNSVNGYVPCLTELYRVYHCSLSTFHHGRSINLAAANPETVEIWFCPILYLNVYQSLRVAIRLVRRPLQILRTSRCAISSALDQRPPRRADGSGDPHTVQLTRNP